MELRRLLRLHLRASRGIFVATIAPEMLCPDRRENVLTLYFSRAITRLDYVLAKLAATAILTLTLSFVPAAILWLFRNLLADAPLSRARGQHRRPREDRARRRAHLALPRRDRTGDLVVHGEEGDRHPRDHRRLPGDGGPRQHARLRARETTGSPTGSRSSARRRSRTTSPTRSSRCGRWHRHPVPVVGVCCGHGRDDRRRLSP